MWRQLRRFIGSTILAAKKSFPQLNILNPKLASNSQVSCRLVIDYPGLNWDIICFPNFLLSFFAARWGNYWFRAIKRQGWIYCYQFQLESGWLDSLNWDIGHQQYFVWNYGQGQFISTMKSKIESNCKRNFEMWMILTIRMLWEWGDKFC